MSNLSRADLLASFHDNITQDIRPIHLRQLTQAVALEDDIIALSFSGYSGTSGISGYSGFSGTSGINGTSGFSGASTSGYSGASGISGASGYSGLSGYSGIGISGYSGSNATYHLVPQEPLWMQDVDLLDGSPILHMLGISGAVSGYSGTSGYSGIAVSGYSGYSGKSGINGISGYSGANGYAGATGTSGYSGTNNIITTITLANPSVGGIPMLRLPVAYVVSRVDAYVTSATSCTFNIEDRSTIGSSGTNIVSSDMVATTTGVSVTSFSSGNLTAGHWLWCDISAISGTPAYVTITILGGGGADV